MTDTNTLRERIAHTIWREEVRSAPSVMKTRTMEAFLEQDTHHQNRWFGYADAVLRILDAHPVDAIKENE